MSPLAALKPRPGGRLVAVKPSGVLAAVTVKLNGWPTNPTAVSELVMAGAALEPPPGLFVGNSRLVGMICFDWFGLYQYRCTSPLPPFWKYSSLML